MTTPGELPGAIRDVGESRFIKQLVYALWGVGKTGYVGSSGPRSLILRPPTDHTDSILHLYPKAARPKEWVVHDWSEMDDAGDYLRLHGHEWDWVWLDSISLWQDTGLDDIWQAVVERRPDRKQLHAGMDKGEYGRNMDRISELVRNLVSMDSFNFGITAFPTMKFDSPSGDRKMMPWVQGTMMSEKVCGYMNMVGYMEKKVSPSSGRVYRVITFDETEDFYGKDQFNAFDKGKLTDPSVPKMFQAVNAARVKAGLAPISQHAVGGGKRQGKKKKGAS